MSDSTAYEQAFAQLRCDVCGEVPGWSFPREGDKCWNDDGGKLVLDPPHEEPPAAKTWEKLERVVASAPVNPVGIAGDLIYAFQHGWIELPAAVGSEEGGERLTRLYAVKRHAETHRG